MQVGHGANIEVVNGPSYFRADLCTNTKDLNLEVDAGSIHGEVEMALSSAGLDAVPVICAVNSKQSEITRAQNAPHS